LFLSGILIVASCILEGVDSLEDVGRGKDEGDLDSEKRTRAKRGVLSMDALLVKVLGSVKDSASCKKRQVRKKKSKERKKCTFLSKTAIRTSNGQRCRSKLRRQKNVKKKRQ